MKSRFSTIDIIAIVNELQHCIGMRVSQVYDIDNKTYLFKLNRFEEKITLLLESGIRIHSTEFEWPKNPSPSGFSMKLRKHIKNKRLEKLNQLGIDRILDLQFGINEAAYHVVLELYDRGNLVLTDCEYTILNILRPRATGSEDVKFVVRERYPIEKARQMDAALNRDELQSALSVAKIGDNLRKILLAHTVYGPALIDHVLLDFQFSKTTCIGKDFDTVADMSRLLLCLDEAENVQKEISKRSCEGFIINKEEKNSLEDSKIVTNVEFHPFLFNQHRSLPYTSYPSFDKAADNYFSGMEGQKIDMKTFQKEKEAMKKLENVKKDHEQRLSRLLKDQAEDVAKAELIEINLDLVEKAIMIVRSAIANQISWSDIWDLIKEAQLEGDPVAKAIKKLKLDINHFTLLLGDPFVAKEGSEEMDTKPQLVDIDLDFSAYANARKYYDLKRHHAKKEQKTLESSEKAFKNAEKKTKQALKEVAVINTITKARKPLWFEKFIWFISSENYLVIAGRDIQQNEVIVKRYMKSGDVYVHADIHGASSVVIKNSGPEEISPKTLNEAATLAVCYSAAWDAKVVTSAWWVYHHQVSKTAPTGEYLTAGSFMIRGKKNYLAPSHLILGFGFLFKLDEDSIERHQNDRQVKREDCEILETADPSVEENIDIESDGLSSDEECENNNLDANIGAVGNLSTVSDECPSGDEEQVVKSSSHCFPDTEVQLDLIKENAQAASKTKKKIDNDTTLIISTKHSKKPKKENAIVAAPPLDLELNKEEKQVGQKRGQKSKLKKIKEKYKYQDDEERELRMKILASAGEAKNEKRKKKKDKKSQNSVKVVREIRPLIPNSTDVQTDEQIPKNFEENALESVLPSVSNNLVPELELSEDENDDDVEVTQLTEESKILNSLSGSPLAEDTILFAVPVCAPYAAMQAYKYRTKMIPGTGRRGKAAKSVLGVFLHDKTATSREKDCLRSVKDQDISRNFPGKVKLSTTNLKKK